MSSIIMSLDIPGQYTICCARRMVLKIPWCNECNFARIPQHEADGITWRDPYNTISPSVDNCSRIDQYCRTCGRVCVRLVGDSGLDHRYQISILGDLLQPLPVTPQSVCLVVGVMKLRRLQGQWWYWRPGWLRCIPKMPASFQCTRPPPRPVYRSAW